MEWVVANDDECLASISRISLNSNTIRVRNILRCRLSTYMSKPVFASTRLCWISNIDLCRRRTPLIIFAKYLPRLNRCDDLTFWKLHIHQFTATRRNVVKCVLRTLPISGQLSNMTSFMSLENENRSCKLFINVLVPYSTSCTEYWRSQILVLYENLSK